MAKKSSSKKQPARKPEPKSDLVPQGYDEFVRQIKERVRTAQIRASLAVNRQLIELYWQIGKAIVERQKSEGWGNAVIDRLGRDLQEAFPGLSGFSRTNVYRMRAFYLAFHDAVQIVPQPVGQIAAELPLPVAELPWGHNIVLIEQVKDPSERLWYARATLEHGWSRSMLVHWIESGLYKRQGKALTNFTRTLPAPQSDLAREVLKDPYNFDFLTLADDASEAELTKDLLAHVRQFLLELGAGFAFVGQQVHLEVGGEDFYVDLLFYHLKLRCFVVIDLKMKPFKPEYAGKMNFYLSVVDDLLRHPEDKPSIGIILCKSKNQVVAKYALRDLAKPVGVASYITELAESLPPNMRGSLPSPGEIEAELSKDGSSEG